MNAFWELVKDKAIEFVVVTIILGGVLYSSVQSYTTSVESKALTKEITKKQNEIHNDNVRNQKLLIALADKNGLDAAEFSTLFENSQNFITSNEVHSVYINQQSEDYKQKIEAAKKRLSTVCEETDLISKNISNSLHRRTILFSDSYNSVSRNQKAKADILFLTEQIRSINELSRLYQEGISAVKTFKGIISEIDKSSVQASMVFDEINVILSGIIKVLQQNYGIISSRHLKIDGMKRGFDSPETMINFSSENACSTKQAEHSYNSDHVFVSSSGSEVEDRMLITSNDIIELINAKIHFQELFNNRLLKTLEEVNTNNEGLKALILKTDLSTSELIKQMRESVVEKEEESARLESVREDFGGSFEELRLLVDKHCKNIERYGEKYIKNLELLSLYQEVILKIKDKHDLDISTALEDKH